MRFFFVQREKTICVKAFAGVTRRYCPLCQVWVRVVVGCPGARETHSQVSMLSSASANTKQMLVSELGGLFLDL